jgi:hypothetical protein
MKRHLPYSLKSDPCAGRKWIEPKLQLAMLVLIAAALTMGQPAYAAGPGFAVGLGGRWYHDGNATSINVAPDGRNLTIINEQGRRSDGYATSPREIEIPSLRIRGHVSHSGRRISWTNGTEWTRELRKGGSAFGQGRDLNGRWYHDGKPTSISVSASGNMTITNENGHSSRGHISGNEIVINDFALPGLRGHVVHNGRRISWSNGTEWRR